MKINQLGFSTLDLIEMENWSKDKKLDFVYHYQNTHFNENTVNHFAKCQFKRQSMNHVLQASQQVASNEATCHLLRSKLKDYSDVVDKQGGVNNYASSVIDLIPHSSNDAQKWTSKAKAQDLLKDFLRPLPGKCHNLSAEGCSAQKPTKAELERFLKNKNALLSFSTAEISACAPVPPTPSVINSPKVQSIRLNKSTSGPIKQTEEGSYNSHPESTVMNAIGSRVFGTSRTAVNQSNRQVTQVPQKSTSFRTAGTELKLQNLKKYGQQPQSSGGSGKESMTYGCNKKSLGGRTRSVNSKFVPPIKSNSQEDDNCDDSYEEEMEDERLRLTDPKMVELIRSEIMDHGPPVEWNDIAGLDYAKATIQEIVVLPMLRPDIFTGLRRPPKGILLFGPPGTGKTLIGKCIASQSKSTFFNISASSLTSKWVGEGEKMVRTLFTLARVYQPAVVFIDEIDSLLSQRSETEHESSRRIKTEFLVQLDGAGTGEDDRILVIGATNRPQELDEAARRRLVKRLYIPLPDHEARAQIVRNLMATERNVLTQQHIEEIAALTEGHSGADMKTLCQEACLGPIRSISFSEMQHIALNQVRAVTIDDFQTAISRVRPSVSNNDIEQYINWDKTYGSGGAPK